MQEIWNGFMEAIKLIISLDGEIYGIVFLSIFVSLASTFISALIGIPMGIFLGTKNFKGKGLIVRLVYTFMSIPPVIAGLFVFLLIMRKGPFGFLSLSYTVAAMVIAQILIVSPIITGLTYNGTKEKGEIVKQLGKTLGANKRQTFFLLLHELRENLLTALVSGFGRAVSEVGAVMIVGGNIAGHTRVMTTYIAQLQSMGNYSGAIAVGIILLIISFVVNGTLYHLQQKQEGS